MAKFSHIDETKEACMVDVTTKQLSHRQAVACGKITCRTPIDFETEREICRTAKIAGLQAAKQTANLVPFCHQIPLSYVRIDLKFASDAFHVVAETRTKSETGVEMEAICAAQNALLCVYDMIKALEPEAVIGPVYLREKSGGKSDFSRRDLH